MAESLWGDLPTGEDIRTPHSILLEQASIFTQQAKGLLIGKVVRGTGNPGTQTSSLQIVAPALNNYSYTVLQISHTISLYPCNIQWEGTWYATANEGAFVQLLRQVLSSPKTKNVIAGLLAQIRADKGEDTP